MTTTAASEPRLAGRAGAKLGFRGAMVAVVALALVARIVVVLVTPHFVPQSDAADYDRIAVTLAQHGRFAPSVIDPHGGPSALRPPLFPVALAAVYKLVGISSAASRWEAGRLLEAVLGAITVALIGLIVLRLWGRTVALLSAGAAAVYPPLVLIGSSLMTESLFIPLLLAAVLTALISRESGAGVRWAALAGILVGLGALTRGNGIVLVVPIAFLVWTGRPRFSRGLIARPLVLVVATALVLLPWTIRNAHRFHEFVPISTETGYVAEGTFNTYAEHRKDFPALWLPPVVEVNQAIAKAPNLNEAQLGDRMQTLAIDYAKAQPGYVLRVLWWNGLRLLNLTGVRYERWVSQYGPFPGWLTVASVYGFWIVGLMGIVGAFTRAARRAPRALWWCPALILLSTVLFQGSTRYRSPADPFFLMLAALGVLALREAWRSRRAWRTRLGMRLPSPAE